MAFENVGQYILQNYIILQNGGELSFFETLSPVITYVCILWEILRCTYYTEFLWKYTFFLISCITQLGLIFMTHRVDDRSAYLQKVFPAVVWTQTVTILRILVFVILGLFCLLILIYALINCL